MVVTEGPDQARRTHYAHFYARAPLPEGAGIVMGNCQAESVRIVIDSAETPAVRVPPVHDLVPGDLPHLERLLARASFAVSQPIRDDYRGLPVGSRQVREALRPGARFVLIPSVRFAGMHPFQVALRVPGHPDPPLVAYQDLRDLAAAAGLTVRSALAPAAVREIAAASIAELRRREEAGGTVRISDVLERPVFDMFRTINHAGNPIWMALGARVREALGADATAVDPGRPLLSSVYAPRLAWVADAWGLDGPVDPDWTVHGETLAADEVREEHLRWYADRPEYVQTALARSAAALAHWTAS